MIVFEDFLSLVPRAHQYERYISGLCPFHQDVNNPSMLVFKDGWFRCLGCGVQGTWKTLWNKYKGQPSQVMPERKTRWGAPNIHHADLETVCYDAHMDLLKFPSLGWYLEMRGIQGRIETNEIGYWNGWYTFPVTDADNNFVTGVFRAGPHIQEATGLRYWCHHQPTMFVPDWKTFKESTYVVVVYGIIDALVLSDLRIPVCTSTAGKNFQAAWLDDVRKPIYILPDKFEDVNMVRSGQTFRLTQGPSFELAQSLGWRGRVKMLDYPDGIKDVAGFYEIGKQDELERMVLSL